MDISKVRLIGLAICLIALSSCTSTKSIKSFDETLEADYIPLEEEIWAKKQADKLHGTIKSKGLIVRNQEVQAYLDHIEKKLLAGKTGTNHAIQVYALKSPQANAAALPNGIIYLNTGLFTTLETEEQLAAILAHEISHITQRHSIKGVIDRKNTLIGAHIADIATGGFGLVYFPAMASIMDFSRDQESEADKDAIQLMQQAGYRPQALIESFEQMEKQPELKHVSNSIYSTHPSTYKRISALKKEIGDDGEAPNLDKQTTESGFPRIKAILMESTLKQRLKARQYHLATNILEEAKNYYTETNKIAFYEGEINLGMYKHPVDAAQEKYWIHTGDIDRDNEYTDEIKGQKNDFLEKAETAYLEATQGNTPYTPAYKRLGEIHKAKNEPELAIKSLQTYLETTPEARDRRYVTRMIQRLEQ